MRSTISGAGIAFEFCDICKLNHDQGRRHKYFPSHARAVAAVLARFKKKLNDVRFFVQNPSRLRPEHAALNRLWCVFCDANVDELGSPFTCNNAIYHLASEEHLLNLRDFMRRHGGKEQIDTFRVSESELIKWEEGCEALGHTLSSTTEGPIRPVRGPSKDIQNEHTSRNMDNFDKDSISNISYSVMPLQNLTYVDYGGSSSESIQARKCGSIQYGFTSSLDVQTNLGFQGLHMENAFGSLTELQLTDQASRNLVGLSPRDGMGRRLNSNGDCPNVLQKMTATTLPLEDVRANVHTGAQPPWLDSEDHRSRLDDPGLWRKKSVCAPSETVKSRKLNPKRVGAAWAEKRRLELEMEKRGEVVSKVPDADWLPNFGRVWQTGTRKESRKEFEMEKRKTSEDKIVPELSVDLQPYISKKMRQSSTKDVTVDSYVLEDSEAL